MKEQDFNFDETDAEIDKALGAQDKDALTRLLKDIARVKKRVFPKKKYYTMPDGTKEKLYCNYPAFIKCLELEAKVYGLLNGSSAEDIGVRQQQIDRRVLEDSKRLAIIAIPKLLEQDRQTNTEGEK
jgi:hypothetical protein